MIVERRAYSSMAAGEVTTNPVGVLDTGFGVGLCYDAVAGAGFLDDGRATRLPS